MSSDPITTTSTTIHGQFLEVAIALEKVVDSAGFGINRVTIDPDTQTGLLTVTATIPIEVEREADQITIKASTIYPLNIGS